MVSCAGRKNEVSRGSAGALGKHQPDKNSDKREKEMSKMASDRSDYNAALRNKETRR